MRSPANPHPSGLDHDEGIHQPDAELRYSFCHGCGLDTTRMAVELHEENTRRAVSAGIHQLAEVAVLCDEHTPFTQSAFDHTFVSRTLGNLGDREHVVVSFA